MEDEKYGIDLSVNYSNAIRGIEKVSETAEKATDKIETLQNKLEEKKPFEKIKSNVQDKFGDAFEEFGKELEKRSKLQKTEFPDMSDWNSGIDIRNVAGKKIDMSEFEEIIDKNNEIIEQKKEIEEPIEFDFDDVPLEELEKELAKVQKEIEKIMNKKVEIDVKVNEYDTKMAEITKEFEKEFAKATSKNDMALAKYLKRKAIEGLDEDYGKYLEKQSLMDSEVESLIEKQNALNEVIMRNKKDSASLGSSIAMAMGQGAKATSILNNRFTKINSVVNNFGKKFGKTLTNGIKNIKRMALSLFGIQTAWAAISKAMSAYMSVDKDISQKMNSAWIGLGSMMAPALERMADLVIKLVAYLNKLIKYLTGVDLLARAITKSTSKAAGSMSKVLASIDQITNLDNGGGLADDWTTPFKNLGDIDITPITKFVDRAKELIATIFDPIKKAWENKGPDLLKSMSYVFNEVKTLAGHVFDDMLKVWTNGTGQRIMEKLLEGWTKIFNIIGNVTKAIDIAWEHHDNGYKILQNLSDIYYYILDLVNEIYDSIEEWTVSDEFQDALNEVVELIEKITKYLADLGKDVKNFYKKYMKEPMTKILEILSLVITIFALLGEVGLWAGDKIYKKWKDDLKPIVDKLYESLNYVLTILKDILNFVVDVMKKDWKKAWEDMKKSVEDIFNPLKKLKSWWSNTTWEEKTSTFTLKVTENWNSAGTLYGLITNPGMSIVKSYGKAAGNLISSIWPFDVGTNYVPNDHLAYVHKGEAVVPKEFNKKEFFGSVGNEDVISAIKDLEQTLREKDMNAYISKKDVGQASVSYINEQSRLVGRSVI